jgi:DNA-directed RNA polymerase subunit RPC12/RpoP
LLYLQAGRARVLGNEVEAGLEELGRGFNMLAADGDQARLQAVAGRILAELGRLGHPELVGELSRRFGLPQDSASRSTISGGKENPLPAKCEHCGANLHPDEVEELKDGSVVCAYCGSRILFPGSEH